MKIGIGALITAIMAFVAWVIKKLKKSGYSFSFLFIVKKYIAARTIVMTNH